jgi:hypothetical protein
MASFHISVRLSHDAWKRYSAQAEVRDLPLGTYLRRRLELQDQALATELDLRARPTTPPEPESGTTSLAAISGTLVEIIYLLRSVAGPQRSAMTRKEIERQGLPSCEK